MSFSNLIWGPEGSRCRDVLHLRDHVIRQDRRATSGPETRRAGCSQLPLLLLSFPLRHLSREGGGRSF